MQTLQAETVCLGRRATCLLLLMGENRTSLVFITLLGNLHKKDSRERETLFKTFTQEKKTKNENQARITGADSSPHWWC